MLSSSPPLRGQASLVLVLRAVRRPAVTLADRQFRQRNKQHDSQSDGVCVSTDVGLLEPAAEPGALDRLQRLARVGGNLHRELYAPT
eukprot:2418681-Rhodomonas_salina.2